MKDLKETHWDLINEELDTNMAVELWNEMFIDTAN